MCPKWLGYNSNLVLYILRRHKSSVNTCKMYFGSIWKGGTTGSEVFQVIGRFKDLLIGNWLKSYCLKTWNQYKGMSGFR